MREKGFTLLELLVSLTLLSLIAGIVVAGFRIGLRAWEAGETRAEAVQRSRAVLDRMAQELRSVAPVTKGAQAKKTARFMGKPDRLQFAAGPAPFPRNPWEALPHLIAYSVEDNPHAEVRGLIRRESPLPGEGESLLEEAGEGVVFDPRVVRLKLRYLRPPQEGQERGEWVDSWDDLETMSSTPSRVQSHLSSSLPLAVEVSLVVKEGEREVELPPLLVLLPLGRKL